MLPQMATFDQNNMSSACVIFDPYTWLPHVEMNPHGGLRASDIVFMIPFKCIDRTGKAPRPTAFRSVR